MRYPLTVRPILILGLLWFSVQGCARWSPDSNIDSQTPLAKPQMSLDSVVVETVLVRFPTDRQTDLEDIWTSVDESVFDIQLRRTLDQNGIRAGLLFGEIPQSIREQIAKTSQLQNSDALEHAGLAADADNKMRQLLCRAGRRKELVIRPEIQDTLTVLTKLDGLRVSGESYEKPTILFDLRATPHGDGQASLQLTPEIQHGEHRQSFVSTEYGVRPEMKRPQQTWNELSLDLKLQPNQILVVASTQPPKSVGKAFFTTELADRSMEHTVLLIRLAETQLDDLFAPDQVEQAKAMAERN